MSVLWNDIDVDFLHQFGQPKQSNQKRSTFVFHLISHPMPIGKTLHTLVAKLITNYRFSVFILYIFVPISGPVCIKIDVGEMFVMFIWTMSTSNSPILRQNSRDLSISNYINEQHTIVKMSALIINMQYLTKCVSSTLKTTVVWPNVIVNSHYFYRHMSNNTLVMTFPGAPHLQIHRCRWKRRVLKSILHQNCTHNYHCICNKMQSCG